MSTASTDRASRKYNNSTDCYRKVWHLLWVETPLFQLLNHIFHICCPNLYYDSSLNTQQQTSETPLVYMLWPILCFWQQSICLPAYPFIHSSVNPSLNASSQLSTNPPTHPCMYPYNPLCTCTVRAHASLCPSIHRSYHSYICAPSMHPSIHPPTGPSIHPTVHPPINPSIHILMFLLIKKSQSFIHLSTHWSIRPPTPACCNSTCQTVPHPTIILLLCNPWIARTKRNPQIVYAKNRSTPCAGQSIDWLHYALCIARHQAKKHTCLHRK